MANEHESDSGSDDYDVNDPRTREHKAYKIAQESGARARRRLIYGDNVDADGENHSPHEEDNHDSLEQRLQNAREARGWKFDEANRRYEWNAQWTGGVHEGVEQEADKRMDDVAELNKEIAKLEGQIDHAKDAEAHAPDYKSSSDDNSSEESSEGEEGDEDESKKNFKDARSDRGRGYNPSSDDENDSDDNSSEESSEVEESDEDEYDDDNYEEDKEDEEDESRVEAEVDTSD